MDPIIIIFGVLAALAIIAWYGLKMMPKPFILPALPEGEVKTTPLAAGLPAPVERFSRCVYGDQIPVIQKALVSGRGRIRPFSLWFPTRFTMVHQTGQNKRHYFQATFFGIPFLKVDEGYIDGESFFESPMGSYVNDPNTNQWANLALWAEGGLFPEIWVTDPCARWQVVDHHTAILFVPYEHGEENFVVRFNPQTGLVDWMEAMRFKAKGDTGKVLWITNEVVPTGEPTISYATWLDDGKPWAELRLEKIQFNLNVSEFISRRRK